MFSFFVSDCHEFTLLCLELLSNHLSLASMAGASACVLGKHTHPLRSLLFRLLDTTTSEDILEVSYCILEAWSKFISWKAIFGYTEILQHNTILKNNFQRYLDIFNDWSFVKISFLSRQSLGNILKVTKNGRKTSWKLCNHFGQQHDNTWITSNTDITF